MYHLNLQAICDTLHIYWELETFVCAKNGYNLIDATGQEVPLKDASRREARRVFRSLPQTYFAGELHAGLEQTCNWPRRAEGEVLITA